MVQLNGVEASVIVDHVALPEYAITTDHKTSLVTCWVPSKANKTLSISWQNSTIFSNAIGGYVKADSRDCKGEKPVARGASEERVHSEVFVSPTFTRPFLFSNLGPAEDKSPCSDSNCLQGLGELSLEIWEVNPIEAHGPPYYELPPLNICDRVRKELTHCITLGDERYVGVKSILKCLPLKRVVTFVFKYRSYDKLREMNIIPDDPAESSYHTIPRPPRIRVETSQMRSSARSDDIRKEKRVEERRSHTRIEFITHDSPVITSQPRPVTHNRKRRKCSAENPQVEDVPPEKKIKSEMPLMSLGFVLQ